MDEALHVGLKAVTFEYEDGRTVVYPGSHIAHCWAHRTGEYVPFSNPPEEYDSGQTEIVITTFVPGLRPFPSDEIEWATQTILSNSLRDL